MKKRLVREYSQKCKVISAWLPLQQSRIVSGSCCLKAAATFAAHRPVAASGRSLLQLLQLPGHSPSGGFCRCLSSGPAATVASSVASSVGAQGVLSETPLGVYLAAPEGLVNAKISAGIDPSLAELGLATSFYPSDLVQRALEWLHCSAELPWWASITAFVITARVLLLPVMIMHRRNCNLYMNAVSSQQAQMATMMQAIKAGRVEEAEWLHKQMMQQVQTEVLPRLMKFIAAPFLAFAPVFGSTFYALNRLSYSGLPSLDTGGALWFADLTLPDPYLGLPLLSIATTYGMLMIGSEMPAFKDMPYGKTAKALIFCLPLIALPLAMHFSSAVVYFWTLNNFISTGQGALLRHPAVAKALNIPKLKINASSTSNASQLQDFQEIFNAKRNAEMPRLINEQMLRLRQQRQQNQQQASSSDANREKSGKV